MISDRLVYDAADHTRGGPASATTDLVRGLQHAELWATMGWFDIRRRYSRSVMGPFWVTLSLAAFVIGLGITYGALFRMPLADYLPYLSVGVVVWTFLSSLLGEGCGTFTGADDAIKQMPAPLSVYAFRLLWRAIIVLAHNAVIIVIVFLLFGVNPGLNGLLAIPGLILLAVNGLAFALTLGTISARFRDIPPLIANFTQMLFFVTPIFWRAENLGSRTSIVTYNPFFHLIEIVRAPLLGAIPSPTAWGVSLAFTVLNVGLALVLYGRFRWRIPYWL